MRRGRRSSQRKSRNRPKTKKLRWNSMKKLRMSLPKSLREEPAGSGRKCRCRNGSAVACDEGTSCPGAVVARKEEDRALRIAPPVLTFEKKPQIPISPYTSISGTHGAPAFAVAAAPPAPARYSQSDAAASLFPQPRVSAEPAAADTWLEELSRATAERMVSCGAGAAAGDNFVRGGDGGSSRSVERR